MSTTTVCRNLNHKLFVAYLLNVVDWICTVYLLSTGAFFEANPIAAMFIDNLFFGFLIKCILPLLAVLPITRFMYILDLPQLKTADMMISFALTIYIAITLDHAINFIILLI